MTIRGSEAAPALFQPERQRQIVELTLEHGRVEVAELSSRFEVTTETIRRDLSELQEQRLVRRVHGGAVAWERAGFEPLVSVRNERQDGEKRRIAYKAVDELPDSGTIIIDSGSTLARFAGAIPSSVSLQVVTNSIPIAQTIAEHERTSVIMLGGKMRKNTLAMVDAGTVSEVENLLVDTLFISADGLSPHHGLTTPYREEAALKQAMIKAARRVVALVDNTKFGSDHLIRFAQWDDIDVLITDGDADPLAVETIESLGTSVVVA